MATSANLPPGAIPANGSNDPFIASPSGPLRYASFDPDQFSMHSSNSPSHARRALEAHLKDTDRRIQDASRLGSTLLQQRKELSARLKDVEQVQPDNEVPADLRKKLSELEREYNEVGKESARAFLPKPRAAPELVATSPAVFSGQARESPTKVSAPSRRQRNQPSNRVHDIEFATEISTSLLAQVRQLQGALAEKDEALKDTNSAKAQLEAEAAGMVQRIKHMDDSEQRYKDENWNLELRLQELEGGLRDTTDKHDRLNQSLKATQSEKSAAQRELDDLRVSHDKLNEDHDAITRQQEVDLHGLRRDAVSHQTEKQSLQKKIDELTAQNTELARGLSYRWNQPSQATERDFDPTTEDRDDEDMSPGYSEPPSPVKGTPRHGMLESETLKSSLNHAHRMIQNLKNNIHREKTEKIELKRMLQDARDELEARRSETGVGANIAKKRRSEPEGIKFKKPARPDRLGANRSSTTEILEDEPHWEDHDPESTPSRSRFAPVAGGAALGAAGAMAFDHQGFRGEETETTDAFETANERDMTTETEAFETGHEDMTEDDGDVTEVEGGLSRSDTVRAMRPSPLQTGRPGDRRSFLSTASTSADEDEEISTPVQSQHPKYRLRVNRNGRRSGRVSDIMLDSPRSATSSNGTPQPAGQSLGDELDAMDDDSNEGTPSRLSGDFTAEPPETSRQASVEPGIPGKFEEENEGHAEGETEHELEISSPVASPRSPKAEGEEAVLAHQANAAMLAHEHAFKKANYVDSGMMTEPWGPEREASVQKETLIDRAGEMLGGALAGFGLGRIGRDREAEEEKEVQPGAEHAGEPALTSKGEAPVQVPETFGDDTMGLVEEREVSAQPAESNDILTPDASAQQPPVVEREPKSLRMPSLELLSATKPTDALAEQTPSVQFQQSAIVSQETQPVASPEPLEEAKQAWPVRSSNSRDAASNHEKPLAAGAPLAIHAVEQQQPPQELGLSPIEAQDFEPHAPVETLPMPLLPRRSSRRLDALYDSGEPSPIGQDLSSFSMPDTADAMPGASLFGTSLPPPSLVRSRSRSLPASQSERSVRSHSERSVHRDEANKSPIEPRVFGGVRQSSNGIPTLVFGDDSEEETQEPVETQRRTPQSSLAPSFAHGERSIFGESIPVTRPLSFKRAMSSAGSQTMVSGDEIDDMMRNKSRTSSMTTSMTDAAVSPGKPGTPTSNRRSIDGVPGAEAVPSRAPRRPASSSSMRTKGGILIPPPLPDDYTNKITAASEKGQGTPAKAGTMGPPLMPASAYKQNRPRTPADRANERSLSRDGTTPRPVRQRDSKNQMQVSSASGVSRRTSVSSFASELDERFNIAHGDLIYPTDVKPATDPRMIQAITQTMIGEYLWKYTRKAGRSETSTTRHRRFFWIHPYTRTLYWSEHDPSTAGRNMLKAKSVAIQSVRVITDDNAYPPGLHRKSIVVVTPGREIVFTAPTGQRHETWFNALSYLLLRTEQEKEEAADTFEQEDVEEFNPGGFSIRRSISRMTGSMTSRDRSQGRQSRSSYNSRKTRTSSPQKHDTGSLAQRQAAAAQRAQAVTTPTLVPNASRVESRTSGRETGSMSGRGSVSSRFNSLTSKFRPGSSQRGSFSTGRGRSSVSIRGRNTPGDPSDIYDASVVGDSAEDLRAVIERQEQQADRLENVRACCDGKHDVGSLSKSKGRHASFTSRFGGGQAHSHGHAHPRAEPMTDSLRPRRGE